MIDSHSHIYLAKYDADREAVLQRAVAAGIHQLLQVGCNLEESGRVVRLAESSPGIYAAVGVHPHDAHTVTPEVLDGIARLSRSPKVVAWGEIGLDFFYDNSPRDVQMEAFAAQLRRAREADLPVVIHTRDAEPETLEILKTHAIPRGGHVHCFTGTLPMALELLELGFHIGFTGIITFKNAADLREVVRRVPLERILIETDSPYLAPTPHRGRRNEPAHVVHVAQTVAELKQLSLEQVASATSANFYRLFGHRLRDWERLAVS